MTPAVTHEAPLVFCAGHVVRRVAPEQKIKKLVRSQLMSAIQWEHAPLGQAVAAVAQTL